MNMHSLPLIEFSGAESQMLELVGSLRVKAWATELPTPPTMISWIDDFDYVGRHWAFLCEGFPVASARLTIHSSLSEVPASEDFIGLLPSDLPSPIASLNRLVVDPGLRGIRIGPALDEIRLKAAEEMGCLSAIGSTVSGKRRVDQLIAAGFQLVGSTGQSNRSPLLREMPPAITLCCRLPRFQHQSSPIS